jgi:hypothetical protein
MVERRAQDRGAYRLVKQVVTARAGLAEAFRGGVSTHEESGDWSAQRAAQVLDGLEARYPIRQLVVRNDQIGPAIVTAEARERRAVRFGGDDPAPPTLQQPAHAVEDKLVIVDDHDELAPCRVNDRIQHLRGL